jgi:threonine/homoserine/homoserine lactone efflux protein
MAVSTVVAFWGLSFLLVLTPGADWAYMISAGRQRTVLPAVGGLVVGYLALTAAVAAGVATFVARLPMVLTVLTAVGAAYLIWLGLAGLTRPVGPLSAMDQSHRSWARQAAKGAGISGLNPKALLLFLALLPQFTAPAASWSLAGQIVLLGMVHTLSCAIVYTGVGVAARVVLQTRPTLALWVTRFSGATMVVIGAVLLVEQVAA